MFGSQSGRLPCYSAVKQAYEFHEGKVVEQRLKTVRFRNVQMETNLNPRRNKQAQGLKYTIGPAWPLWPLLMM